MKIVGPNQYEVAKGDLIRVTATAVAIPYSASYGPHANGTVWKVLQQASAENPTQIQEFEALENDDHFEIIYGFGPAPAPGGHYVRTVECGAIKDGPFWVRPIGGISTFSIRYFFYAVQPLIEENRAPKTSAKKKKTGNKSAQKAVKENSK